MKRSISLLLTCAAVALALALTGATESAAQHAKKTGKKEAPEAKGGLLKGIQKLGGQDEHGSFTVIGKVRYDNKGRPLEIAFFREQDKAGKLTPIDYTMRKYMYYDSTDPLWSYKVHRIVFSYKDNGITYTRYDVNGNKNGPFGITIGKSRIVETIDYHHLGYSKDTYNESGLKISEQFFDVNKGAGRKVIYTYDEQGNPVLREILDKNGTAKKKETVTKWKYDSQGNPVEREIFNAQGDLLSYDTARTVWKYDADGNKVLEENYDAKGELTGRPAKTVWSYDGKGKLKREEFYNSKGKLYNPETSSDHCVYTCRYNDNGMKEKEEYYSGDPSDAATNIITYTYKYEGDKTIKEPHYSANYDGSPLIKTITVYDKKNRIETEEHFRTWSDNIDEPAGKTVTLFDKHGNMVQSEKYNNDGYVFEAHYYRYFPLPGPKKATHQLKVTLDKFFRPLWIEVEKKK